MEELKKQQLTPELLEKLEDCETPEEVVKLAKDNDVELSLEEAQKLLDALNRDLTDEEMEKVAGGNKDENLVGVILDVVFSIVMKG